MNGMEKYALKLKQSGILYRENEPMCEHTTFRIGGPAGFFVEPHTEGELECVLTAAREAGIKYFLLGRGSNVLFCDKGYNGAVISTKSLSDISVNGNEITCGCGASLTSVACVARDHGLTGLEFAYGIPGFVGGAVYMNAGAYGGQMSDVLESSVSYDVDAGEKFTLDAGEHKFAYRHSVYMENRQWIVLSATFRLKKGEKSQIDAEMNDYMERRRSKQPLEFPSAGSVFKRCQGHFTGQMVEEQGMKGLSVGGAQISDKHAGFIVNRGGATAADVMGLVEIIKSRIRKAYGLELQCELIYVE